VLSEAGAVDQPLRFSGRIYDQDSQLTLHGLRWYDPAAGVFLTPDPLAYQLDGMLMVNHYRYVDGDPVNRVDTGGLLGIYSGELQGGARRPRDHAAEFRYTIAQERASRVRQAREFGAQIWGGSKLIPVVGIVPSAIDAAWYLGSGAMKYYKSRDTTELKKSASELAGIVAGILMPSCKAGSLAMKAVGEGLSVAAGYLTGKFTEAVLDDIGKPSTRAPAPSSGYHPRYGFGLKN
jgi:RHS repeat-associated protein